MMILAIGLGALGYMALRRAHHRRMAYAYGFGGPCSARFGHHAWHGWHGGGFHGRGHGFGPPWARRGGARRWMVMRALAELDASPAQERAIIAELEQLEEKLHGAGRKLREQRGPLADAMRGPELDEGALAGIEHDLEASGREARAAVLETVGKVHALLDDRQRETLGSMLGRGVRNAGPRDGGPFRT